MKNQLRLLCLFLLSGIIGRAAAQTSATVTLNVVLSNFASITLASGDNQVTLAYNTQADYVSGVSATQSSALTVQSLEPFTVKVYASGDLTNTPNTIPVGDFSVLPTLANGPQAGVVPSPTSVYFPNTASSEVNLISSTVGSLDAAFTLTYAGPGNSGTPNSSDFLGKPAGTYTTTVNYVLTTP